MGIVRVWIQALGRRRLLGRLWGRLLWRGRRVQLELDFRVGELVRDLLLHGVLVGKLGSRLSSILRRGPSAGQRLVGDFCVVDDAVLDWTVGLIRPGSMYWEIGHLRPDLAGLLQPV